MGTKNNPGANDCYAKAAPDEPMFVLLARDPMAPGLVRRWAEYRGVPGSPFDATPEQIQEAHACADAMEKWRIENT